MPLCRVAIVAGEESGDLLGAGLMSEIKKIHPEVEFIGVGGSKMRQQGLVELYDMERLAVMGLIEPLKRLPELLSMRLGLAKQFVEASVDLFIGIDAPDFNLGLAKRLKAKGVKTLHYVSPSVWAWRQGRIKSIAKSIDLMLTLLPFEAAFYEKHKVPVRFVGHPLASQINNSSDFPKVDQAKEGRAELSRIRSELGIVAPAQVIALLPGSRTSEIKHLMPVYLKTAEDMRKANSGLSFVVAAVNQAKAAQIQDLTDKYIASAECQAQSLDELGIKVVIGETQKVIAVSEVVLAASGTTTLEVMLINRPLVVAYRADPITYRIISSMLKVPFVSLPNLIAGKQVVAEFLQKDATPENLRRALDELLKNNDTRSAQCEAFSAMADQLRLPSDLLAAKSAVALASDASP